METERINRNEWFEPNAGNKKDSFQGHHAPSMRTFRQYHIGNLEIETLKEEPYEEHDARMRTFAQSHSHGVSGLETMADEKPPRLENIGDLSRTHAIGDTGEPRRIVSTPKWIPLIPGCMLLKRKVSQN
jgi:hypothetical protein